MHKSLHIICGRCGMLGDMSYKITNDAEGQHVYITCNNCSTVTGLDEIIKYDYTKHTAFPKYEELYGELVSLDDRFETTIVWDEEAANKSAGRWKPIPVCKLCYGTGQVHRGGSFGGPVTTTICECKQFKST